MTRYCNVINHPIYIYTIPKAGTYFLASLVESLGYYNTGWHVSAGGYLDTKKFDNITNKQSPSKTKVKQSFIKTFTQIKPSQLAFGHLSPYKLPNKIAKKFIFISSYRHPREVLESEFIDFRYRRNDVRFISKKKVASFSDAFEIYMNRHGSIMRNIFVEFLLVQDRYTNSLYKRAFPDNNLCIDFKDLVSGENSLSTLKNILDFFNCKIPNPSLFLEEVKSQENKTKSVGLDLPFERDELWNNKCKLLYEQIGFKEIEEVLFKLKSQAIN